MRPVYYLSFSDFFQGNGYVFPSELLENTYSLGIWTIATDSLNDFLPEYSFDAVVDNELVTFKLIRMYGNFYLVDTLKYGVFYFRIVETHFRSNRYIGNSREIAGNEIIYQVVPVSIFALRDACRQYRFYFVGSVDKQASRFK